MADIKAQLKAKNGDNLYPVTSLAYVSAVSSGGIVINGNSIYTSAIPQANVYKLTTSLGAKQAKCSAGFRTYVSGATIGQNRYFDIAAPVSSGTLTVSAGSAYRIFATGNTVTVNAEGSASSAGVFGLEGHAAILLTNSSYLKFGTNVVLGTPLQIDAINNCTLRFHDGHCIIDVEDHEAAHAVTVATGTGTGSLYYWANWANTTSASAAPAYVSFSDALDGTACTFNGVTVNGDKHFVGNGKTLTVVTGTATASSKTYLTNMAISGATITGGTVYTTDVLIPSGATTVISSPLIASNTLDIDGTLRTPGSLIPTNGLVISGGRGTGNGGAINLGGTFVSISSGTVYISGCALTSGYHTGVGGALNCSGGSFVASNCIFSSNSASVRGGAFGIYNTAYLVDCHFADNDMVWKEYGRAGYVVGTLNISNCVFSNGQSLAMQNGGKVILHGSNSVDAILASPNTSTGAATLTSSAIVDLTSTSEPTPIAPGGTITFEPGGATVTYTSGTGSKSYMMDNVALPAGAKLTNTGAVNLGGTNLTFSSATATIDGVTLTSGSGAGGGIGATWSSHINVVSTTIANNSATGGGGGVLVQNSGTTVSIAGSTITGNVAVSRGGGIYNNGRTLHLTSTVITGNTATTGGGMMSVDGSVVTMTDCVVSGNTATSPTGVKGIYVFSGSAFTFAGSNVLKDEVAFGGSTPVIIAAGATINVTGNTNNPAIYASTSGTITFGANVTIINSAGVSSLLNGGAAGSCTRIRNDGILV